jgi:hypothetical protein
MAVGTYRIPQTFEARVRVPTGGRPLLLIRDAVDR